LDKFRDADFENMDESSNERAGGNKKHPSLLKISRPYRVTDDRRDEMATGKA
jgi:hypothetical protein